ncbi:riboflavin kinase-domain-containing protein [Lentinula guzmanii]|uniref:Riboflavin kinase n=1 Tax=Lentinula guzmanii TaxID=2804957 RepID=A0AA38JX35_9AGAR|nr:riboflavin kinase-domain-containing protein [Lentinula guzmanii]
MVDDPESKSNPNPNPITTSTSSPTTITTNTNHSTSPVPTTSPTPNPNPTTTPTSSTLTSTHPYRTSRPSIVGPPSPLYLGSPYPIRLRGKVCRGFGRGGKDLGCPTANLPDDGDGDDDGTGIGTGGTGVQAMKGKVDTGVFYGFAKVLSGTKSNNSNSNSNPNSNPTSNSTATSTSASVVSNSVHPMVMSLGWNPFYKNERLTAEIHVMYDYGVDFYGLDIKVLVLGYVRPELDYLSRGEYKYISFSSSSFSYFHIYFILYTLYLYVFFTLARRSAH